MVINIDVVGKIATAKDSPKVVCGNSDYEIAFSFDDNWAAETVKTARFVYQRHGKTLYDEVVFEGNACKMPPLYDVLEVKIGVYAGNLTTSTPAIVECEKSIRCGDPVHDKPNEDVYDQIVGLCSEAVKTAAKVEKRANDGEFNGDDYVLTDGDKNEIAGMVDIEVDQTYDPNSENAQSGKAVFEALSIFTPKQKNYELIATIKAVPDVDGKLPTSIIFTEDSNGYPFELTDFFLVMTAGCTDGNTGLYLNANNSTVIGNVTVGFKSDGLRVSTFYFNCNKDIITVSVSTSNATPYWYSNQLGMARTLNIPLKAPTAYNLLPVTRVSVSAPLGNAKTWIDGSNFELWGVRK